jgi:hypothetical protein
VKVGCLHSNPQVDQHLGRFNAVSLDRDSWYNGPDASEHFAPDLPGIVSSTPRIGHLGTGNVRQMAFTISRLMATPWA